MTKKKYFLNLPINTLDKNSIVKEILKLSQKKDKNIICYLNAFNLNLAIKNNGYREILNKSNLIYADGWGPIFVAKVLGYKLSPRLTTYDFFYDFCQKAEEEKIRLFLLGSSKKNIKKAVKNLKTKYKKINIVGFHSGYLDKVSTVFLVKKINEKKTNCLIIGLGSPKQEKWALDYKKLLKVNLIWCVGGLFDYLSGSKSHCPSLLGSMGFQWIYRFICEPKRLWKRYLIGIPGLLINTVKIGINEKRYSKSV